MITLTDSIEECIEILSSDIEQHQNPRKGLFSGRMGLLLYNFYKYKLLGNDKSVQEFWQVLNEIHEEINRKQAETLLQGPLSFGMAGLGFVLHIVEAEANEDLGFEEELSEIDNYVYVKALELIRAENIDYLHGAMGILNYLTRRINVADNRTKIENLLIELRKIAIVDSSGIRFRNSHLDKIDEFARGKTNLGLAHGLTSVLLCLLNIYEQGVSTEICSEIIEGGVKFILKYQQKPNFEQQKYTFFPGIINEKLPIEHPDNQVFYQLALSWCYSDMGFCMLFYRAGRVFKNAKWIALADKIGEVLINRKTTDETQLTSTMICHGTAGTALFFRQLAEVSTHQKYLEAYQYWLEKTIDLVSDKNLQTTEKDAEFLEGKLGTSLVLMSALVEKTPLWNQILLLS